MFPIIIKCDWILKIVSWINGFEVIGLEFFFPFIIVNDKNNKILIRHETIHFQQMLETLVIGFYILYVFYYLENRLTMNHNMAYNYIPFETEALNGQRNIEYLEIRKRYSWWGL